MKKLVVGLVMFVLLVAVLRRFGWPLGERAMEKCQEMFADCSPEGPRSVEESPMLAPR